MFAWIKRLFSRKPEPVAIKTDGKLWTWERPDPQRNVFAKPTTQDTAIARTMNQAPYATGGIVQPGQITRNTTPFNEVVVPQSTYSKYQDDIVEQIVTAAVIHELTSDSDSGSCTND